LDLAVITAVTGGLIAVISLASRPTRALVMIQVGGKGDFGRGVPYGVAIAAGALVVIAERLAGWTALAV
jgi:prepilin peptidase CpaA